MFTFKCKCGVWTQAGLMCIDCSRDQFTFSSDDEDENETENEDDLEEKEEKEEND